MHTVIIYESMYGNTKVIAEAIAEGLTSRGSVEVLEVGAADPSVVGVADLLIVGGPTHAFGMSRANTRRSAAERVSGSLVSKGDGVREWLARLSARPGLAAAAFDTRLARPHLPGSAARRIGRRLRRLGMALVTEPVSFYVAGGGGPLITGERNRARLWSAGLAAAVHETPPHETGRR